MKITVDGLTLAYDDSGTGSPILLIHGFPLNRKMWLPQVPPLVAAGFRVITPDLRGFGESDAPEEGYAMDTFADDVVRLLDRLEIQTATVAGMSMGGYVLFNLLKRYPERVASALFLVTRCNADDAAGKARRSSFAEEVRAGNPQALTDFFAGVLFAEATPQQKPELVARVKKWLEATSPHGLVGGLLAMRDRPDSTGDLGAIRVPALVVAGEQDRTIPPEVSRIIAAGIPEARFCLIPDAGHMANLEQPDAVNQCLVEFLRGIGS